MDKKTTKNILLIILISILLIFALWHFKTVFSLFAKFLRIIRPVIIGFVIAFVLKNFYCFFEKKYNKLFKKNKSGKISKILGIITIYLIVFAILTGIFLIVIPQIGENISKFKDNFDTYKDNAQQYINNFTTKFNVESLKDFNVEDTLDEISEKVKQMIPIIIKGAFGFTSSLISIITDIVVGFVFSIYFLFNKNTLWAQFKKILYAFLKKDKCEKIISFLNKANSSFSRFIKGQLTEAVILGVLCFIGLTIFRFPYALLIATLVGSTSLIPIIGAFIGTIPGVFLLWLVKPSLAIWFIVFIIVLQQIEGNFIYPRVVGTNVGLPALWVLFAITIGGGLYGILGMIIAVPLMSLIYESLKEKVNNKLKIKNINSNKQKV